jgi:hypothetical protein
LEEKGVGENLLQISPQLARPTKNLTYLLHPLSQWQLQEIARKAAATRWGKK